MLAELERPGESRRFSTPALVTLRRHQIPGFLEAVGEEAVIGDGAVAGLRVLHDWDALEIAPEAEGEQPLRPSLKYFTMCPTCHAPYFAFNPNPFS